VIGRYGQLVAALRYLMIGFAAFGAAAVLAHPDWPRLITASLVPALPLRPDVVAGGLALLGTTLTSYVYVWETIGRGVEEPADGTLNGSGQARVKVGAVIGSAFTAVILWFMLVAAAATLGRQHQAVASAQDAARALRPLAGSGAADLFAAGLVTSAVIALPVLMATTAHVVGAHFDWRRGLSERIGRARGFYAILVASIGLALATKVAEICRVTGRCRSSVYKIVNDAGVAHRNAASGEALRITCVICGALVRYVTPPSGLADSAVSVLQNAWGKPSAWCPAMLTTIFRAHGAADRNPQASSIRMQQPLAATSTGAKTAAF